MEWWSPRLSSLEAKQRLRALALGVFAYEHDGPGDWGVH